jgi:ABC-type dipeptide/oligopeptide/nickel transport system permease subunit
MLSAGREVLGSAPHIATIPGLMIFFVTLSLNMFGDGLRDALDPHLRT